MKKNRLIDQVVNCAKDCLDMYPDNETDHDAAFDRYLRWAA